METKDTNSQDTVTIDLVYLAKSLLKRAWAILLITLLVGGAAFGYTKLFIKPKYSSSAMLYVNNGMSFSGISISDLTASQDLVKTYLVILNTRTTMLEIKEKADVKESWQEISAMITAGAVNETEIFKVTVTSDDAEKSQKIAQAITEVLPVRVEAIIDGCSMELVDGAVVNNNKVSPDTTNNTAVGMAVGFIAACVLFVVLALLDDRIHNEDFITQHYDLPILAKIPNLTVESGSSYYYYSSSSQYGYTADDSQPAEEEFAESEEEK